MAKSKKKKKSSVSRKKPPQKLKRKVAKKKVAKRKKKVLATPKGYHSVIPCLTIKNAARAIDFYKTAFGAKEVMRFEKPDGKIGYAELKIGDAKIMLGDERPEMDARSPEAYGGTPVGIHLYVNNVDGIVEKAVSAGAILTKPVEDMFYGDRSGTVTDPYGHKWHISTHVEDVSPSQMKKRVAELFGKQYS